jgi:SAM-dependent methyltransferase
MEDVWKDMRVNGQFVKMLPDALKNLLRPVSLWLVKKNVAELSFWRSRFDIDNGNFDNQHFGRIFLAIAQESDDSFLRGKVVADFGCGPRGSLVWAKSALLRIGIDVLADRYADEFTSNIVSHGMIYLKSTEKVIPLPDGFVDVMFTLNAMDHVDRFPDMCREILRVLKSGGEFIGSFNLGEPESPCEPQQLDEKLIKENLLKYLTVKSYRVTRQGPREDFYAPFFRNKLSYSEGEKGILWVRAIKDNS